MKAALIAVVPLALGAAAAAPNAGL